MPPLTFLIGKESCGRCVRCSVNLMTLDMRGALFPVELANGVASMSSYPSAKILQRFIEST